MEPAVFPMLFAGVLLVMLTGLPVLMIVIVIVLYQRNKAADRARTRALEAYARQRGWEFAAQAPGITPRFGAVAPFNTGSSRRYSNFIGFRTRKYMGHSFDYQYVMQSGKSSETFYFHVVALELPAALPRLELRPEGTMRGIAEFFGVRDLQFESDAFNNAWNIQASNPAFAHEVVNPRMIEWLMSAPLRFANFTIDRDTLYTFISGKQDPHRIDGLVWYLEQFLERVPGFVWDKAGGR